MYVSVSGAVCGSQSLPASVILLVGSVSCHSSDWLYDSGIASVLSVALDVLEVLLTGCCFFIQGYIGSRGHV